MNNIKIQTYFIRVIFLSLTIFEVVSTCEPETSPGKIIAFAGISGVGKSTMAKELAQICGFDCALEPEEPFWPELVQQYKKHDPFDVLMAFRQMWLVSYKKAVDLRSKGKNCFLDSIYIKILHYELGMPGIQWLFPSSNPYSDILQSLTKIDVSLLPDPDYIILMDCSFDDWKALLNSRGRNFDQKDDFKTSFEDSKKLVEDAVLQLGKERNIPILRFDVIFGDKQAQTLRLKLFLQKHHLLEEIK